jgi:GNAT superfamily N-acetyltransferase
MITRPDGYTLSSDPSQLDMDLVHHWLSTDAYWALGRPRARLLAAISGSLVFGVYRRDGSSDGFEEQFPAPARQVAFARVVTDSATFAWLCDVYVDHTERGRGLGTWMVGAVRDELSTRGVRRILLATADAHGVYAKLGFTPLAEPDRWMELRPQVGEHEQ